MSISPLPMIEKVCIQLVGISGKAGSGKDAVANYLRNQYEDTYIYPFAAQLKLASAILFGLSIGDFHDRELKESVNSYWGISPRKIAQYVGTESVRTGFQQLLGESTDFWIKRLCGHINGNLHHYDDCGQLTGAIEAGDTIVIPDVRFQNEYDWILANGGIVIQLIRPGADGNVGIAGHASEMGYTAIDNERNFICVNDGTIEELYAKIDAIMKTTEPTAENMEL